MQTERRSQRRRTETTRTALLEAGRTLFVEKGFAGTSTPELVAATGLTRGALYHHYEDKQALFAAVVEQEAHAVAQIIETMPATQSALDALELGSRLYLEAMAVPGRTRLLLVEGPAVLGVDAMEEIHARHGNRTLRLGLEAAMQEGEILALPVEPLTLLLGAMFDRAALAQAQGDKSTDYVALIGTLIAGLRIT
jgi:AcrR family transcriptional regulator